MTRTRLRWLPVVLMCSAGCFKGADVSKIFCATDDNCPNGYTCADSTKPGGCVKKTGGVDGASDSNGTSLLDGAWFLDIAAVDLVDRDGLSDTTELMARDVADVAENGATIDVSAEAAIDAPIDASGSGGVTGTGGITGTGGVTGTGGTIGQPDAAVSDATIDAPVDIAPDVATCPSTYQCVPRPPSGWSGPVIYASASTLANCTSNYPTESLVGGLGISADTTCSCSCTATPLSSSCGSAWYKLYSLNAQCSAGGGSSASIGASTCVSLTGAGTSLELGLDPPAAQCASGSYQTLGAPSWTGPIRACGGATENAGACTSTGEACIPKPPGSANAQICVYHAGTADCPVGYATPHLIYQSWSDGRSCPNSCSCTAAGGTCTSVPIRYSMASCNSGGPQSNLYSTASLCIDGGTYRSVVSGSVSVGTSPTCTGSLTTATGSVSGVNPITVCCQ